jgi:hypothetical protein
VLLVLSVLATMATSRWKLFASLVVPNLKVTATLKISLSLSTTDAAETALTSPYFKTLC